MNQDTYKHFLNTLHNISRLGMYWCSVFKPGSQELINYKEELKEELSYRLRSAISQLEPKEYERLLNEQVLSEIKEFIWS